MKWWTTVWLAAAVGCAKEGQEGEEPTHIGQRSFVAALEDSVHVGIVGNGEALSAYACDGTLDGVNLAEWFEADVEGEAFSASSDGGASLGGTFDGAELAEGTLTLPDGTAIPFQAEPSTEISGLFRGEAETEVGLVVAGWIRLSDEDQRGAVRNRDTRTVFGLDGVSMQTSLVVVTVDGLELTLPVDNYINAY
jgi:hypothetical protein